MTDQVNHPEHYNQGSIECIDALESMYTPEEFAGFLRCNIVKYFWRANHKGTPEQDIAKADWYSNRLKTFRAKFLGGEPFNNGA